MAFSPRFQKRSLCLPNSFTIIEMLAATAIFSLIMIMIVSVVDQASTIWRRSSQNVEAFQSGRLGFDILTRNISQTTLNTYLDYDSTNAPSRYLRKSELRFVSGPAGVNGMPGTPNTGQAVFFQAPASYTKTYVGMDSLLNTCGYYVSFTTNNTFPSHAITTSSPNPYRYRLVQLVVPAESKNIYDSSMTNNYTWFTSYIPAETHLVADNVIALVIRPQDPSTNAPDITSDYTYDTALNANADPQPLTAHQLPPVMQVTLVSISEISAKRMENGTAEPDKIKTALNGKFTDTSKYDADLSNLTAKLAESQVQYRVFTSAVPMRESKWTK